MAITYSMTHCTGQIKTHNRRLGKQDASPAKSPEKAESFVPDDPLEESLGPEDPLEAFWPLGVAGLPKMALTSESLVAAIHRQTVRLAITHAYMCHTCSNVLYMQKCVEHAKTYGLWLCLAAARSCAQTAMLS